MSQTQDNEIDLFELFQTLWNGKWKIIAVTFLAALVGVTFGNNQQTSYHVSAPIQKGKQSAFIPYISVNALLKEEGLLFDSKTNVNGYKIDRSSIFELFIEEFNDYQELISVLGADEFVKQSIKDLNERDQRRALVNYAKSFVIKPVSEMGKKQTKNWRLEFKWHDQNEGKRLLNDAIQKMLINIQNNVKKNINDLALSIDIRNSREKETLRNELLRIKTMTGLQDEKRLRYLVEQSNIAKGLGIEKNQLQVQTLPGNFQGAVSLSVNSDIFPYYLRGYKSIDKEISIMEKRSDKDTQLRAPGFIDVTGQIFTIEKEMSSSYLRSLSDFIEKDDPNKWVVFDLELAESKSMNKTKLYVILSVVLGGIIGTIYVLISNTIRKRPEPFA